MSDETRTRNSCAPAQHQLPKHNNKIIIGSKPASGGRVRDPGPSKKKIEGSTVSLKDASIEITLSNRTGERRCYFNALKKKVEGNIVSPSKESTLINKTDENRSYSNAPKKKVEDSTVSLKDVSKESTSTNNTDEKRSDSNSPTIEVCEHCNQTYASNSELVAHLLDVVNSSSNQLGKNGPSKKTYASTDEDSTDPLGLLKPRSVKKKRKYRRSNLVFQEDSTPEDSGTRNKQYSHEKPPLTSNKINTTSLDLKRNVTVKEENHNKHTPNECFEFNKTHSSKNNIERHAVTPNECFEFNKSQRSKNNMERQAVTPNECFEFNKSHRSKNNIERQAVTPNECFEFNKTRSSKNNIERQAVTTNECFEFNKSHRSKNNIEKQAVTPKECFEFNKTHRSKNNIEGQAVVQRKEVKLFKCLCGIHFTSYKSIQKHFGVCRPTNRIITRTCNKCGYRFEKKALPKHLLKHHSNEQYTFKIHEITPDMRNIYKCGSCEVLCYIKEDLTKHFQKCNPYDSDERSYFINERSKFTASGYNIVTVDNPNATAVVDDEMEPECKVSKCNNKKTDNIGKNSEAQDNTALKLQKTSKSSDNNNLANPKKAISVDINEKKTVYKCVKCDIYYLTVPSIKYHFDVKHVNRSKVVTCVKCCLKFPCITIKRHLAIQHKELKLQLKDLLIVDVKSLDYINTILHSQRKIQAMQT